MPITRRILSEYEWVTVFEAPNIKVMAAKGNNNVHILHATRSTSKANGTASTSKVRIEYNVFGRRFASPSEAIKYYNAEEARILRKAHGVGGGQHAAGSPKQTVPLTRVLPRR